ncbi:MAG: hypothetical protein AAF390_18310 [Pseudomonadota bacterium]
MTLPDWLKPGIYGALIGAAFVGIVGFSWLGWVTGGSATAMADEMARDEVVAAFVPFCVGMSQTDEARVEKLAAIEAATASKRRDAVMATGWATMPGTDTPNADLARACLNGLNLDGS